ncbi:MAG: RNA 2',3'-cyclic phosphodiesterase [Candidatus Woesearchaeota archaeon]
MSLFIAVDLPDKIKKKISLTQQKISNIKGLNPINTNNLHLTLVFIGEEDSNQIINKLKEIEIPSLNINIEGFGFFPDATNPKVLWLRVINNTTLITLQRTISKALNKEKDYNPYITLGRIKDITKDEFNQIVDVLREFNPQSFETNNIYLYNSIKTNIGTIYNVIHKF